MDRRKSKGITAWLVTWEWVGDHAKPNEKIAAILNPHWSADRVRAYVELLYANSFYSLSERIDYAKNRSFNPYPADFTRVKGVPWIGHILCGHNPHLFARKVDDLAAAAKEDGKERAVWTERPMPDFDVLFRRLGIPR